MTGYPEQDQTWRSPWSRPLDPPAGGSTHQLPSGPPAGGSTQQLPSGPSSPSDAPATQALPAVWNSPPQGGWGSPSGGWNNGGWPGQGAPGWPPPQPPVPAQRRMGGFAIASLMIFLAIVVVGVTTLAVAMARTGQQTASRLFPDGAGGAPAPATTGGGGSTPNGGNNNIDWDAIATKVDAGVVDINTQLGLENAQAAGTGIVIDPSGIVLTNNHVIAGATRIRVTTVVDGQSYDGSVIGYNRSADVAVLQLAGVSGLSTVSLGDSSKVRVGDPVLAIGNAGGKGGTPATAPGTVTALDQTITASDEATGSSERLTGLIEVRANIEAGDSGGPLVDVDGKVIGIDTAASAEFQVQASGGQGFAIPINQAMSIGGEIRAGHASSTIHIGETAFLGVQITNKSGSTSGASVSGTVSGSPAAQAGLAAGDVIKSVDGHTVDSPSDLTTLLDTHHPGDRVSVGWVDSSGRSHTATVTLAKGPAG